MSVTASVTVGARSARWCRTTSRARRSATLTRRMPLPMATTLVRSDRDQLPPPRHRADRPRLQRPARPPAARRRADRGVRPRGRRRRQGRGGSSLAAVLAGRPRVRGATARGPRILAGPCAQRLPGAAARPAGHRPVLAGQPVYPGPARPAGPGRLPDALPRRQHRAGRRADQARTDRRAVERARAEFRRHVRRHLLVVRAARPPGGVHHRRATRALRHRGRYLPAYLPHRGR